MLKVRATVQWIPGDGVSTPGVWSVFLDKWELGRRVAKFQSTPRTSEVWNNESIPDGVARALAFVVAGAIKWPNPTFIRIDRSRCTPPRDRKDGSP